MSPVVASRLALTRQEESPLSRVSALGADAPVTLYVVVGVALHVLMGYGAFSLSELAPIGFWYTEMRASITDRLSQTVDIEPEEKKEEPPPPAAKEPEPEPVKMKEPPKEELPSPPALAQAAQVITAKSDPNDVADFTGFVQGNAQQYAGGTTAKTGTDPNAVTSRAAVATGTPGGVGTAPPTPAQDKSRSAGLLGSTDWSDCPFPPEADAEQIDQALVTVQVNVGPDGRATGVSVVSDPGHGFGRAAKSCANQKRYATALDREGNPLSGQTKPFRVRFRR